MSTDPFFPLYTRQERRADAAVHAIGVPLGLLAAGLLIARASTHGAIVSFVITLYAAGLIGMFSASAAYQLAPPGRPKEILRRLDRAMIFVMIAGTYTPISVTVLFGQLGLALCLLLWAMAALGIFITLRYPRRFELALLALYLGMGWMLLVLIHAAFSLLAPGVLALIVAGGVVYTAGAMLQRSRVKFHNPLWHALVLTAAALHYAAISLQLTGGIL